MGPKDDVVAVCRYLRQMQPWLCMPMRGLFFSQPREGHMCPFPVALKFRRE